MPSKKFLWTVLAAVACFAFNSFAQVSLQQLQTLDTNSLKTLVAHSDVLATHFDLLTLHYNPSYLDNKATMKYFIMLNNCGNSGQTINLIQKSFNSEFDFPSMTSFYKAKATNILSSVPMSFIIVMDTLPDPANPRNIAPIHLGEYDLATGSFPFVTGADQKTSLTISKAGDIESRDGLNNFCGWAYSQTGGAFLGGQMPIYYVSFPKMTFSAVKVDEVRARQYVSTSGVGAAGAGRAVSLWIGLEMLPTPPQIVPVAHQANTTSISYRGKVTKVEVRDNLGRPLGTLYP